MQLNEFIKLWKSEKETGRSNLDSFFKKGFYEIEEIPVIYHPILYKYLKNPQIKHWNEELFSFSQDKIKEIESNLGRKETTSILLSNLHLLINAYESIVDLEERIIMMNKFKGSEELKAKVFSINIYNDLLNSSFSNILKIFIEFQSSIEKKDLSQKTLTSQIELLASSKRGYQNITSLADSNVRNAISHGGVKVLGTTMEFFYRKGNQNLNHKSTVYEFKDAMFQLYDGITAIILSWISYLCEESISYKDLYKNDSVHNEALLFFERLSISSLLMSCTRIYKAPFNNRPYKQEQINVEFTGMNLDVNLRILFGLWAAGKIFRLRELPIENTIMITFKSSKVPTSFFKVDCSLINDLIKNDLSMEQAARKIIESKNVLMPPINDEDRNEFEDTFRYYLDIKTDEYFVTEVEDISLEDKKRFKCVAYLETAVRPSQVKKIVREIVNQMLLIENYGFSNHKVKHGKMEADIIYIVLYKREVRKGKDRALYPNNNNFIAQVQYDVDKEFPIRNGFIDRHLKQRRESTIEYNWNPNF